MHPALADQVKNTSSAMEKSPDIVIFGAGIAGLWTFNHLKTLGYDVLLLEKESIGCGQTIASQGIIHSGLKFSLAGKVNTLAKSISAMPDRWRQALNGDGLVNLSDAKTNAISQHLLIPAGFFGNLTKLVTQKALGNNVHEIVRDDWPQDIKSSGFKGSLIFMGEPVLDIPSVLRALAAPYQNSIKKITNEQAETPFKSLQELGIAPKRIIFTSARSNHSIAKQNAHDAGLQTQARPLLQGMIKNTPFPLFGHLVGKTDKPVASVTTHKTEGGELVWYLGGGVAERNKDAEPTDVYRAAIDAFSRYLPDIDTSDMEWAVLPIDRIEGKSNTDGWMPDTPTIHTTKDAMYCWPTKLTFAPMLADMIIKELAEQGITPSQQNTDFSFLDNAPFSKTPWDKAKWIKLN